jgi:cobalt-zinc-cadmium efflux system membrane fusion protein
MSMHRITRPTAAFLALGAAAFAPGTARAPLPPAWPRVAAAAAQSMHDAHADEHDEHGAVRLTAAEREEFGIEVATAGPGTIETYVTLPGEVRPNADRLAHLVPRYPGVVAEVRARIGDRVEKGDVLALIESDESLSPFQLRTLISGTVIAKHITLGEALSRDQDAYVVADLDTVWVDLTVYQRDVGHVRVGQPVRLHVGHEPAEDDAAVAYVTPVLDERTRTATARVVLPNPRGAWRPGMFVTARVRVGREEVGVVVPRSALHTLEDETIVFVERDEGLEPAPVRLGLVGETHAEIVDGLAAGDRYVSRGGFTLKAELGKSGFGHGHGH